ncbi:hypothetical protein BaRGS_00019059 [Batillaria attramentaria]|uniref:Uncharacterized protein n=1 Tax=Batillaria attramentaria TaxID=370345 RepID=A0ABD0KR59_9CAEN
MAARGGNLSGDIIQGLTAPEGERNNCLVTSRGLTSDSGHLGTQAVHRRTTTELKPYDKQQRAAFPLNPGRQEETDKPKPPPLILLLRLTTLSTDRSILYDRQQTSPRAPYDKKTPAATNRETV